MKISNYARYVALYQNAVASVQNPLQAADAYVLFDRLVGDWRPNWLQISQTEGIPEELAARETSIELSAADQHAIVRRVTHILESAEGGLPGRLGIALGELLLQFVTVINPNVPKNPMVPTAPVPAAEEKHRVPPTDVEILP